LTAVTVTPAPGCKEETESTGLEESARW
jgi:hypothetical protein